MLPPLLLALVAPVVGRVVPTAAFVLAAIGAALSSVASVWALVHVIDEGAVSYQLAGWAPPVGIEYVVDNVAAFVASVISSVATIVIVATRRWADREAHDRTGTFYGLQMLLLAGLLGMVVTGDLFNLFVFIEISSLAAYALVFMGGRRAMIAAFRYLILGSIGGSFYLLGVGFLYFHTGTLNMAAMRELLTADPTGHSVEAGAVFIFTGIGLKMGLFPMHLWLPDAYSFAPSSVNALIAPIMTKVSAYVMVRMFISVFPAGYLTDVVPIADALLILGMIGIVFGSFGAMAQKDIRRLLAYSSIGQLGMIALAIGLATPLGFVAALLHIMNHAVMKGTLFLFAASVRFGARTTALDDFVGLGRKMPLTMVAFSLAALAMVGIPPFAGFFSKWYAVQASIDTGQWIAVVVILASSLLSAVYLFRVIEAGYLRPARPEPHHEVHDEASASRHDEPAVAREPVAAHEQPTQQQTALTVATERPVREAPLDMLVPTLIMAVATLVLGIANAAIVTHILMPGL